MSLSMYEASSPIFTRQLKALSAILSKAETYAETRKIDPSVLLNARLAPDMHPLVRQVQIASDGAKGGVARLAGTEPPSFPDVESTFAELQDRISRTIAFIEGVPAEKIAGSETRTICLKLRGGEMQFSGQAYLTNFVIPNFFFHTTSAYAILRHNGLEIGKRDFLGAL